MKNSTLAYNNGQIYYEVTGTGQPVVFIHGFSLDHRMWQPQVDFFSQNYQVITYDARGFGKSSVPTQPYSHADDLHALLRHLGVTRTHIVGLSMGGRIAVNFTLAHPDMVHSLALMDAALDGYADTVDWDVHAQDVGLDRAKESWLNHELFSVTREQPAAMTTVRAIVNDYSGWHWWHGDLKSPKSTNARSHLGKITAPTLIMVGEKDLTYFHDIANVLTVGVSRAQKRTIPGAGHMINLESPIEVNKLLAEFIAQS